MEHACTSTDTVSDFSIAKRPNSTFSRARLRKKAVVPMERFREKFGDLSGPAITARIAELAEQFLHEPVADKRRDYAKA